MMTCKDVERMLLESGGEVSESCRKHLADCSSCRDYHDIVKGLSALSHGSVECMEGPSAEVDARVMMMAHVSLSRRRRLMMVRRLVVPVAACIALLLGIVWHGLGVAGHVESVEPVVVAEATPASGSVLPQQDVGIESNPLELVAAEWTIEQLEADLALLPVVFAEQFGSAGVEESEVVEPSQSVVIGGEFRSFASEVREMEMMMVAY